VRQELLERQGTERKELANKRQDQYIESRPCPIQKPAGSGATMVRIKQDRGPGISSRTRGNAHPQRTHSKSVTATSVLGIAYSPTARSMDAVKGADMQEVHPWKLLAMCSSRDMALNVAAIYAIKVLGRDMMCAALSGGYAEMIATILGKMRDPKAEVRTAMAQALATLAVGGDQDVIDELLVATEDEDDYVRASALSTLALITPRETSTDRCTTRPVRTVMERLTDDDPDVREAAIFALGAMAPIGCLSLLPPLAEALAPLQDSEGAQRRKMGRARRNVWACCDEVHRAEAAACRILESIIHTDCKNRDANRGQIMIQNWDAKSINSSQVQNQETTENRMDQLSKTHTRVVQCIWSSVSTWGARRRRA